VEYADSILGNANHGDRCTSYQQIEAVASLK
jgi:hypothetical protein